VDLERNPLNKKKKTGRARQGTLRAPHMRGGGSVFPPKPRDWSYSLPKKVARMGLKCAISAKFAQGNLFIVDSVKLPFIRTKELHQFANTNGWLQGGVLIVEGEKEMDRNLQLSSSNLHFVKALSGASLNVYDILKKKYLVLSKQTVEYLQNKRLKE